VTGGNSHDFEGPFEVSPSGGGENRSHR
jgi:hypothetical protein